MANPSKIKGSAYEAKIRDLLTAQLKIEFKQLLSKEGMKLTSARLAILDNIFFISELI